MTRADRLAAALRAALAEYDAAAPDAENDNRWWKRHDGGPMPVDGMVKVDVRHEDGEVSFALRAEQWNRGDSWWEGKGRAGKNIVAYRVSE